MRHIFLLSALLFGGLLLAQETQTTSTRRIEPVRTTTGDGNTGSMLFPEKKEVITYRRPIERPKVNLKTTTDLVDPGVRFKGQKFSSDGDARPFISDTFLGEIRTGEIALEMICRDHMYQDGDRVRVWIDDKPVIENISLTNAYQGFIINLQPGFNKIEIEALNAGLSAPNTAQFKVKDKNGNVLSENIWNLNPGVKATLIVIKE